MGLLGLSLASCTEDFTYTPEVASGMQVYFDEQQPTTIELTPEVTSFNVPVYRVDSVQAADVSLTFAAGEGNIFTVPTTVHFDAGKKVANVTVTFDPKQAKYGQFTGGTITITGDKYVTPYGKSEYTFQAGIPEWKPMSGKGSFRDDLIMSAYGFKSGTYDVAFEQNILKKGVYRIKPYSETMSGFKKAFADATGGDTYFEYDASPAREDYMVIHAEDPNAVYFTYGGTGIAVTKKEGYIRVKSAVQANIEGDKAVPLGLVKTQRPGWFGKLQNGVITFTNPQIAQLFLQDGKDGPYATTSGLLAIALPGAKIGDYSMSAAYTGRFTDTGDKDVAKVTISMGADVATLKYALVPAKTVSDAAAVKGVIDGSIASETLTASGEVGIPFAETGEYYIVLVAYDADGNMVGSQAVPVKLRSSKDGMEVYKDIYTGFITMSDPAGDMGPAIFGLDANGKPKKSGVLFEKTQTAIATLSQSEKDPTKYRITPFITDGYPLEFMVKEDGTIVVDATNTGIKLPQEGAGYLLASTLNVLGSDGAEEKLGFVSKFDKVNRVMTFAFIYHDSKGGIYLAEYDKFELDDPIAGIMRKPARKAAKAPKSTLTQQMISSIGLFRNKN